MASTKVRGISIELSADTSGVIKGLKNANGAISSTQEELKDIQRLLKMDPKNITLLKQQYSALQTQIGNSKTKIEQLKKAQEELKNAGVSETSSEYQALQREIIATEKQLKKLESTAGSGSARMLQISEAAKDLGSKMETAGKAFLPVTGALAGLGAGAIAAFNEVDAGADIVIKKTGATGDAAKEMQAAYEDVATSVKGSFEDAGSAVGEVATRLKLSGDELTDVSKEFIKFAEINDQDVTSAVTGIDMAMKTFGIDTKDAGLVMGKLTKASQDTGISVDKLESLLQSSGAQLKQMGLGLGSSVDLMASFEANGIDSSSMLARLGKGAATFQKKGMNMSEGLADIISRLQDSTTEAEATAEAYEIFGSRGGLAFITAAKEGKIALDGLSDDLSGYGSIVGSTYEGILDETDKLELTWKETKVALADAGKTILEMVAPALQKLANFVKELSAKWRGLDAGTKQTIVKFAGIAAAIGPALIAFGKLSTAISSITRLMSTMKFASFLTNPVTIAIGAIAGLAAGIKALDTALYNAGSTLGEYEDDVKDLSSKNDDLTASIEASKKALEDKVTASEAEAGAAEALSSKLNDLMAVEEKDAGQKELIKNLVEQLNELVPNLGLAYDEETDKLNKTNAEIQRNIDLRKEQAIANAYWSSYTDALKAAADAELTAADAQDTLNKMYQEAIPDVQELYDYVQQHGEEQAKTSTKLTASGKAISAVYMSNKKDLDLLTKATQAVTDAQKLHNSEVGRSEKLLQKWEDASGELISTQAEAQAALNKTDLKAFREELGATFGVNVPAELNKAINAAASTGVEIPKKLRTGILNGSVPIETAAARINRIIDSTQKKAVPKAEANGKATTNAAAKGISSQAPNAGAAAGKVTDKVNSALKGGIEPAGKTGTSTAGAYSSGIGGQKESAYTAASSVSAKALSGINSQKAGFKTAGQEAGQGYADGIADKLDTAAELAEKLARKALDRARAVQNSGSPSRVMMKIGGEFGEGYAIGIESMTKKVASAAANLVSIPQAPKIGGLVTTPPGGAVTGSQTGGAVQSVTNYTQNNYSPKALSRIEIYRQTKNLLNFKGA